MPRLRGAVGEDRAGVRQLLQLVGSNALANFATNLTDRTEDDLTKELWTKIEQLEIRRLLKRPVKLLFTPSRLAWLSGMAAAAIILTFLLPLGRESEIRAETLLARAATSAKQTKPPSRLRIRTRTTTFVRPAAISGDPVADREEAAIRELFVSAHYNWQEPLSGQAYSDWRHNLGQKIPRVYPARDEATGHLEQTIETTAAEGVLREASLTLDAALAPVSGSFRFEDQEWVEITVAPESPVIPKVVAAIPLGSDRTPS